MSTLSSRRQREQSVFWLIVLSILEYFQMVEVITLDFIHLTDESLVRLICTPIISYLTITGIIISLLKIFRPKPLKNFKERGLLSSLLIGLIAGLSVGLTTTIGFWSVDLQGSWLTIGLIVGPTLVLTTALIFSSIIGLIYELKQAEIKRMS